MAAMAFRPDPRHAGKHSSMPTVSVALATYNGGRFVIPQLESIANQTAMPSELVVVDDCSSDGTLDIISEFAKTAPFPIRIIQNEKKLGYRYNFMKAAAACASDLIAFCDQDDIWDSKKIQIMRRAFEEPGAVLAYHNSTLIDEDGAVLGRVFKNRSARFAPLTMHPWMIIPGHAQMISRSLLRFNSLHANSIDPYCPNEPMPHDQWFAFWASVLGETFYISDCLAQYRQHPENTSGWPHIGLTAYILDHISNAANYVSGESLGAENRLNLLHQCHALLAPWRNRTR